MDAIAENRLIQLNKEFTAERKYIGRLSLYEKHFRVLFNLFPAFDSSLSFLFNDQQVDKLKDIYYKDRDIYTSLRKKINVGNHTISFDVQPVNSCRLIFNCYLIEKFTGSDEKFNAYKSSIDRYGNIDGRPVADLLQDCDLQLNTLRQYLQKTKRTDFNAQFMKVFYEGYTDRLEDRPKTFRFKKKVIELWLYSQGLLFASYRRQLYQYLVEHGEQDTLIDFSGQAVLDWRDRVLILKDMGLLELLKNKIQHPVEKIQKQETYKTICKIIGQHPVMTDTIERYINLIEQ